MKHPHAGDAADAIAGEDNFAEEVPMIRRPWLLVMSLAVCSFMVVQRAHAEGEGQADFDEALRVKVTADDMRDLNQVVELLESAIQKGLDVETNDFAEEMLVEALMQRGAQLAAVIQAAPGARLGDGDLQKVRAQAVTDLQRAVEYDTAPPQAPKTTSTSTISASSAASSGKRRPASTATLRSATSSTARSFTPRPTTPPSIASTIR